MACAVPSRTSRRALYLILCKPCDFLVQGVTNNAQQQRRSGTVGSASSGQTQGPFDPPTANEDVEPSAGYVGNSFAQMLSMEGSESGYEDEDPAAGATGKKMEDVLASNKRQ